MPIVKFVKNSHQSKTALSKSLDYVTQEKKTLADNGMRCRCVKLHEEKYRKGKWSMSSKFESLKQKNAANIQKNR